MSGVCTRIYDRCIVTPMILVCKVNVQCMCLCVLCTAASAGFTIQVPGPVGMNEVAVGIDYELLGPFLLSFFPRCPQVRVCCNMCAR